MYGIAPTTSGNPPGRGAGHPTGLAAGQERVIWLTASARTPPPVGAMEVRVDIEVRPADGLVTDVRCSLPSPLLEGALQQALLGSHAGDLCLGAERVRELYRAPASDAVCRALARIAVSYRRTWRCAQRTGPARSGEGFR